MNSSERLRNLPLFLKHNHDVSLEAKLHEIANEVAQLEATNTAMLEALKRLVLAFDVGDMKHTSLNGRGYAALVESREAIHKAKGD